MFGERDINDPRWKACRYATFARDKFKCQLCGSGGDLECHHILRWADREELRFVVSNLITLCSSCHGIVTGHEDRFVVQFQAIVQRKKFEQQMSGKGPKKAKEGQYNKTVQQGGKYRMFPPNLRF